MAEETDEHGSSATGGLVKGLLNLGEERMTDVVGQLLANERFVAAMQSAVTQGLSAKRSVDKGIERLLNLANVPTLEDVDQLREKLQELEDLLGDVLDRVQRLDEAVGASAGGEGAPKKKRRASSKRG